MKDPAAAVVEMLTGHADITYDLNVGQFPSNADKAILVNQSGGRPPFPHLALNFPSVQIQVRGKPSGYVEARAQMAAICDRLLGIGTTIANTDTYRSCNQLGDVIYLGQDDRGRPFLSANFWFIVEPSDLGNRVPIA